MCRRSINVFSFERKRILKATTEDMVSSEMACINSLF
jgi:hypothetical protein